MHRRRLVRDAMVAHLKGLPLTGNRVYPFRTRVLEDDELPAIRVYTPSDAVSGETFQAEYEVRVEVRVEVVAKALDEVEDTIDAVCEQVEAAVAADDQNLGGACVYVSLQGTDIDYEDEDQTTMVASIRFEAIATRN